MVFIFWNIWKKSQKSHILRHVKCKFQCPFACVLSVAIYVLQGQSWIIVTGAVKLAKPEISTIRLFTEKACRCLSWTTEGWGCKQGGSCNDPGRDDGDFDQSSAEAVMRCGWTADVFWWWRQQDSVINSMECVKERRSQERYPGWSCAMSAGLLFTGMEELQGEQRFWRGGDKSSGGHVRDLSWLWPLAVLFHVHLIQLC